jgi:hypothetical protein
LIYLVKMPDRGQQARILLDWVLDVMLGRNLVCTPAVSTMTPGASKSLG